MIPQFITPIIISKEKTLIISELDSDDAIEISNLKDLIIFLNDIVTNDVFFNYENEAENKIINFFIELIPLQEVNSLYQIDLSLSKIEEINNFLNENKLFYSNDIEQEIINFLQESINTKKLLSKEYLSILENILLSNLKNDSLKLEKDFINIFTKIFDFPIEVVRCAFNKNKSNIKEQTDLQNKELLISLLNEHIEINEIFKLKGTLDFDLKTIKKDSINKI